MHLEKLLALIETYLFLQALVLENENDAVHEVPGGHVLVDLVSALLHAQVQKAQSQEDHFAVGAT